MRGVPIGTKGDLQCGFCHRWIKNVVARRGLILECKCGAIIISK